MPRSRAVSLAVILLFVVGLLLFGGVRLTSVRGEDGSQVAERDPDPARGKTTYYEYCAACHNASRKIGSSMVSDTGYFVRSGVTVREYAVLLTHPIRQRPPGALMPAFDPTEISDADILDISAYLYGMHPAPTARPAAGKAEKGAPLYAASCAACHGAEGEGQGQMTPVAIMAQQLKQAGVSGAAMHAFVGLACRSGSVRNMPTYSPDTLSDSQLADLAAYIWAMPPPEVAPSQ